MPTKNLLIASALAKFQGTLVSQLGKPVGLVLVGAFSALVADILAAVSE